MGRHRILLVSGNPDFLTPYSEFLRFVGFDVHSTRNADEAMQVAGTTPVDLVVTDFPTLVSSGRTVTAELRASRSTQALPIVCVTSHVVGAELSRPYGEGASLVLPMPIPPQDLALAVARTLREHQRRLDASALRSGHPARARTRRGDFDSA